MSNQPALQQLIRQRNELKRARGIAVRRSDLPVMAEPGFMESNLQHIESLDAQLEDTEKAIMRENASA